MDIFLAVFRQTLIMFLFITVGFLIYRSGKLTREGSRGIANLMIWVILPAVILGSFCIPPERQNLLDFSVSASLGALALGLSVAISCLAFRKRPMDRYATAFPNIGFIGIPLVTAVVGRHAVLYIIGAVALNNVLQSSFGLRLMAPSHIRVSFRDIARNPLILSVCLGLTLFTSGLGHRMPGFITDFLSGIAAMNAPVAMILLGTYLAQADVKSLFTRMPLYALCAVRLVVIPLCTLFVLWLVPASSEIKMSLFLAMGTSVGANASIFAQLYDCDYVYAGQSVAISTLLCMLTLPLLAALASPLMG